MWPPDCIAESVLTAATSRAHLGEGQYHSSTDIKYRFLAARHSHSIDSLSSVPLGPSPQVQGYPSSPNAASFPLLTTLDSSQPDPAHTALHQPTEPQLKPFVIVKPAPNQPHQNRALFTTSMTPGGKPLPLAGAPCACVGNPVFCECEEEKERRKQHPEETAAEDWEPPCEKEKKKCVYQATDLSKLTIKADIVSRVT